MLLWPVVLVSKLFPINLILDKLDRIVLCLIETAWPGFPSALIVSRYAVSAQWQTGPLPVCLCVWNERPLPNCLRAARSDCSLHPQPMSVCLFVCLPGGNLTPLCSSMCLLAERSQLASRYSVFSLSFAESSSHCMFSVGLWEEWLLLFPIR